jgi:hypothetical protein
MSTNTGSTYANPAIPTNTGGVAASFSNSQLGGTAEFLQSNSLVAKVSFLILTVLLFVFILRLGTQLLNWLLGPPSSPMLLKGMKDAKKMLKITQDPKVNDSITLTRSDNQRYGTEFTYSVWLFIDDINYKPGQKKHIFHKGSEEMNQTKFNQGGADINTKGMAFPNNGPGLYLTDETGDKANTLVVVMNTFEDVIEEIEVPNIPLNKWINVVLRIQNRVLDVYINGSIAIRHKFTSVPKQNYGDVYINMNGGFSGQISSLQYFNRALTGVEIQGNNSSGPNMATDTSMHIFPPYFSLRWFFGSQNK